VTSIVRHSFRQRASFAIHRPDILFRKIRGKDLIEIDLDEVAPYLTGSPVILEAGACNGADTVKFAQRWPDATIYTFEPVPELFADVERRTSHLAQVRRYPMALSDRIGQATLHVSGDTEDRSLNWGSSSLLTPAETLLANPQIPFGRSIAVQTVTIADWAHGEGVDRIDFMWLDMQGMELPALKAAGPVLATTRAICMEVAREELYVNCPMYDEIISWMKDQGFRAVIDRVTLWFGNILFVRH
jgi:FkbM family methyltransferase